MSQPMALMERAIGVMEEMKVRKARLRICELQRLASARNV